jgi:hypothetical protein
LRPHQVSNSLQLWRGMAFLTASSSSASTALPMTASLSSVLGKRWCKMARALTGATAWFHAIGRVLLGGRAITRNINLIMVPGSTPWLAFSFKIMGFKEPFSLQPFLRSTCQCLSLNEFLAHFEDLNQPDSVHHFDLVIFSDQVGYGPAPEDRAWPEFKCFSGVGCYFVFLKSIFDCSHHIWSAIFRLRYK